MAVWNNGFEATPAGTENPSFGDDRIRELKSAVRERLEKELFMDLSGGDAATDGWFRAGAAKVYGGSSAPTTRPDGVTALTADDNGRVWRRSTDGLLHVYVHGTGWVAIATTAATADRMVLRDDSGRAKVAAPAAEDDIARKAEVDAAASSVTTHEALTNPHSSTSLATASRLVLRDASGRAAFADPAVAGDAATKGYVDGLFSGKTIKFSLVNHGTSVGSNVSLNAMTVGAITFVYGYGRKNTTGETISVNLPAGGTYRLYSGGFGVTSGSGTELSLTGPNARAYATSNSPTIAGGSAVIGYSTSVSSGYYFVYSGIIERVS